MVFTPIWNYNVSVPLIAHSWLADIIEKIALNFTTAKARIIYRMPFGKLNSLCWCAHVRCLSDTHAVNISLISERQFADQRHEGKLC